jgi:Protein of unknown function (DUF3775)
MEPREGSLVMTARALETLTADQVHEIATASEAWQQEQQARLDVAGVGGHMDDGRAVIGEHLTQATLDEIRGSPTRAALRQLIADLEPVARLELVALMWAGQGPSDDADFISSLEQAERATDASDVDYIAGKEPLARYLRAGLERIGAA